MRRRFDNPHLRPDYLDGYTDANIERRKREKTNADRRVQALGYVPGARVFWQGCTGTLSEQGADPAHESTPTYLLHVGLILDASPDGSLRERAATLPICELVLIG